MKYDEYLNNILATFDLFDLEDQYKRRVAVKPLYDYFQTLILEVAVHFCGLNRSTLKNCHLKSRWDMIKSALWLIEDPTTQDKLVNELQNMRSSIEHNDYEFPSKTALMNIRKHASEFRSWILAAGQKYHKESKGFSFIQKFLELSRLYVGQADWAIHLYGEKPPFSVEKEIVFPDEEHPYNRLKSLRDALDSRVLAIHSMDDLKKEDLDNLVQIIKEIERLDAKEDAFLHFGVCPKCGGKIVESQTELGGSPEDPMPSAILYRVGCEKCDYELNSETIDV